MSDLLIRNISDDIKRDIEQSAKLSGRSLSEQTKRLIAKGLESEKPEQNLGDALVEIFRSKQLGDTDFKEIWGAVEEDRKTEIESLREVPFSK